MGTEISDLPDSASLDGDELTPMRDVGGDVKVTVDKIADYVIQRLTSGEALAKVIAAAPESNGLNSNHLQGFLASFFRDAGNLNAGVVPNARLPNGATADDWQSGGAYNSAGWYKGYWKIPEFIHPDKIMIQYGWGAFTGTNSVIQANWAIPFSSGFGGENKPLTILTPECRMNGWTGITPQGDSAINVELNIKLFDSTLTQFKAGVIRDYGSNIDKVRCNYLSIGHYV